MKIALAQCALRRCEMEENLQRVEKTAAEAAQNGADIVIFPEMFLSGYMLGDKVRKLAISRESAPLRRLCALAAKLHICLMAGFPEKAREAVYNSTAFIDKDGKIAAVYRKAHLFGEADKAMFTPGDRLFAFDTSIGRIGMAICYDVEFPETFRQIALQGAALVCVSSANMYPYEDLHTTFLRVRALENGVFAAYTNAVGQEDDTVYCGRSSAYAPDGEILVMGGEEEALLYAEIAPEKYRVEDENLQYLRHRRTDLY